VAITISRAPLLSTSLPILISPGRRVVVINDVMIDNRNVGELREIMVLPISCVMKKKGIVIIEA
jgi:hypothetical protein